MTYLAFAGNTYEIRMYCHFAPTLTDAKDMSDRLVRHLELHLCIQLHPMAAIS